MHTYAHIPLRLGVFLAQYQTRTHFLDVTTISSKISNSIQDGIQRKARSTSRGQINLPVFRGWLPIMQITFPNRINLYPTVPAGVLHKYVQFSEQMYHLCIPLVYSQKYPDFLSVSSLASFPFLSCCHRTTTTKKNFSGIYSRTERYCCHIKSRKFKLFKLQNLSLHVYT